MSKLLCTVLTNALVYVKEIIGLILFQKEKIMKKVIVVMMAVVLWNTSVFAFDPMGPPTAGLKQGQYSIGIEHLRGEMDIDYDNITVGGVSFGSLTLDDIKITKAYANFGFGVTDNLEVFLRPGIVKDEDSDSGFAIGAGVKATFFESADGKGKWGILAQLSWASLEYDDESGFVGATPVSITNQEADIIEVQIALGPTYQLDENISIYGGPFLHFINGDTDAIFTVSGVPYEASADIEQDSIFGGYIGMEIKLAENTNGNIELQGTGSGYALGAGLIWKF